MSKLAERVKRDDEQLRKMTEQVDFFRMNDSKRIVKVIQVDDLVSHCYRSKPYKKCRRHRHGKSLT